ncbi:MULTISPECIES: dihydrodipicolinate synthase family protein [unclassified Brevibacterium]|uniref:dihydrodipicolinate synthase family protein n=1 Tax=unclassified Brevibacterium TaxID=2614124 RepID=UPI00109300F7|nr:dihydrodipicolinate synthase family protein [Brevibacterium sp. S22]TGD33275.1 dihydrodipicolinate synthase family protein [Brevibacterium sp. S22]
MTNPMRGVFAVPTTPYTEDGDQNLDALSSRIDEVLASGVTGLLGLGATGEALALRTAEREAQIKTIVSAVDGRAHVVIGCMAYTPSEMSAQISKTADWGADAVMVTPPFYGGLEPEAVIAALHPVLTASELPVMVYNNPHSTGADLLPDHLASLQDTGRLWSVKETSGAATRVRELRSRLGEDTEIFVGADGIALEGFVQGASGWVAASAWLLPGHCRRLWELADRGDWAGAVDLWRSLGPALGLIEDDSAFISLIKQALGQTGREQGPVRPPLPTAAPEALATLLDAIAELERKHTA